MFRVRVLHAIATLLALVLQKRDFAVFGCFLWAPGGFVCPPGLIGSVFLWRCFSRQKPLVVKAPSSHDDITKPMVSQIVEETIHWADIGGDK